MDNYQNTHVLKFLIPSLDTQEKEDMFRKICSDFLEPLRIDTNIEKHVARIICKDLVAIEDVQKMLAKNGFPVSESWIKNTVNEGGLNTNATGTAYASFRVEGISCAACEVKIERTLKKLPGVTMVDVDAKKAQATIGYTGNPQARVRDFNHALADLGYVLREKREKAQPQTSPTGGNTFGIAERPSFWELVMLFTLVFIVGSLFNRLGLLKQGITIGSTTNFTAAFILGLVAATSQCLAVVGGLLLSVAAKFREKHGATRGLQRAQPIVLFSIGRVISYGISGGLIGFVGQALTPSPFFTGMITIIAAVFMIAIGLNILRIQPRFLLYLQARVPKGLMRKIHDLAENSSGFWTPLALGAVTVLIPCGFTQSLQIYALSTGSFAAGASALTGFALGTVPALFALWYASSAFRGKAGQLFFKFAGAAVLLLGLWNIQNGLTITGYPLRLPTFSNNAAAATNATDSNVVFDGKKQQVKMTVSYDGYTPNEFTIRAGVPVRWEISGNPIGCQTILQAPKLGLRERLLPDQTNIIEFTPHETGDAVFSCSMGMFRGVMHIVN